MGIYDSKSPFDAKSANFTWHRPFD